MSAWPGIRDRVWCVRCRCRWAFAIAIGDFGLWGRLEPPCSLKGGRVVPPCDMTQPRIPNSNKAVANTMFSPHLPTCHDSKYRSSDALKERASLG
eukprot:4479737-Prymnesium_polylepis.2